MAKEGQQEKAWPQCLGGRSENIALSLLISFFFFSHFSYHTTPNRLIIGLLLNSRSPWCSEQGVELGVLTLFCPVLLGSILG